MKDRFHYLNLKEAIAVQIFYSSSNDENLVGKTLNGDNWIDTIGIVTGITFRENGVEGDSNLQKLITEKNYLGILKEYGKSNSTFRIVVAYKNDTGKIGETDLTHAIEEALSPEELPKQIIGFLLQNKEFSFLK